MRLTAVKGCAGPFAHRGKTLALLSLTRDASAVNAVVNHPAVRPFVGAPNAGDLDLSPLIEREENIFPFGEHGGFALLWTSPHTREVHTFVLPEGRGAWAQRAAAEMIRMAAEAGTETLWTQIDPAQPNVRLYAERAGMRPTGEVLNTLGKPHDVFRMAATCQ